MRTSDGRGKARRPVWQLRMVIPGLMVVAFLLDAGTRFMPIAPLTFRAWEALVHDRPSGAAFAPNRRYYSTRSYGDLAALGNLPDLRQYHPELFTTDALGFRNPPHLMDAEVDAILAGDSFAVGSGVSDGQTLSAQLSDLTGCVVYNAGSDQGRVTPAEILALARRLHLRNRLVIRLYSENAQVPALSMLRKSVINTLVARTPDPIRGVVGWMRGLLTVSPLQILSEHAWKAMANDRILPNRYSTSVARGTLDNGDEMLFQAEWVHNFYRRPPLSLDYWRWLRDDLQKARLDLLVVLVPDKYRVYRPFLVDQSPVDPGTGDYLDRLGVALGAMGVPVFDLTPVLSSEAARYLKHEEYLYWLDDPHWNARGIKLAAEAIREKWPLSEASCLGSGSQPEERP